MIRFERYSKTDPEMSFSCRNVESFIGYFVNQQTGTPGSRFPDGYLYRPQ